MVQPQPHEGLFLAQNLLRRQPLQAVAAAILLLILFGGTLLNSQSSSSAPKKSTSDVAARLAEPGTAYRGTVWHNERTVAVETLGETKFARCDVHTVSVVMSLVLLYQCTSIFYSHISLMMYNFSNYIKVVSEDGTELINDWLFLEEVPAVNVIVQTLEGHFIVFSQKKYAIPGETLSPVGGFIDPGESPLTAAKREVLEELGLGSRRTLRTVREGLKGYSNGRGGNPGKTLEMETVAKIIKDDANPPVIDEFGLPDGLSRTIPSLDFDVDWVYLGR